MIMLGFCNSKTNDVIQEKIDYYIDLYIKKYSDKIKIEKALVKAIYMQESRMSPYCIRYEKHLKTNTSYLAILSHKEVKDDLSFSSLGIGQILFGTAKWLGFKGSPEELILLKNSVKYSILYIRYLIKKYYNIEKVISAYNQGSPKWIDKNKDGIKQAWEKWRNWRYVKNVLKYYQNFGGIIKISKKNSKKIKNQKK